MCNNEGPQPRHHFGSGGRGNVPQTGAEKIPPPDAQQEFQHIKMLGVGVSVSECDGDVDLLDPLTIIVGVGVGDRDDDCDSDDDPLTH